MTGVLKGSRTLFVPECCCSIPAASRWFPKNPFLALTLKSEKSVRTPFLTGHEIQLHAMLKNVQAVENSKEALMQEENVMQRRNNSTLSAQKEGG